MSRILALIFVVLLAGVPIVSGRRSQASDSQKVIAVDFCNLVRHPELYDGATIQLRASWLQTFEWNTLYDVKCNGRDTVIEAILDCPVVSLGNVTLCSKQLDSGFATDEIGNFYDGRRAEFTLVGRFEDNRKTYNPRLNGSYALSLHITSIEQFKRISPETPWPGKNRNYKN